MTKLDSPRTSSKATLLMFGFIVFFLSIAFYYMSKMDITAFDYFVAVGFMSLLFILGRKYYVSSLSAIMLGCIFITVVIGDFVPGVWPLFNGHWDWVMHGLSAMFLLIIVLEFMIKNHLSESGIAAFFVAFCIVIALGAVVELVEYWGFVNFGYGEGFLGFGHGDDAENFGPWENSSIDLTNNLVGSLVGVLLYAIKLSIKKKIKSAKEISS